MIPENGEFELGVIDFVKSTNKIVSYEDLQKYFNETYGPDNKIGSELLTEMKKIYTRISDNNTVKGIIYRCSNIREFLAMFIYLNHLIKNIEFSDSMIDNKNHNATQTHLISSNNKMSIEQTEYMKYEFSIYDVSDGQMDIFLTCDSVDDTTHLIDICFSHETNSEGKELVVYLYKLFSQILIRYNEDKSLNSIIIQC